MSSFWAKVTTNLNEEKQRLEEEKGGTSAWEADNLGGADMSQDGNVGEARSNENEVKSEFGEESWISGQDGAQASKTEHEMLNCNL